MVVKLTIEWRGRTVVAVRSRGGGGSYVRAFVRSCGDCGDRGLQVDGGAVHHISLEMGGMELGN